MMINIRKIDSLEEFEHHINRLNFPYYVLIAPTYDNRKVYTLYIETNKYVFADINNKDNIIELQTLYKSFIHDAIIDEYLYILDSKYAQILKEIL